MVTEDYVSFETAKLLKEKGFDEFCRVFYDCKSPENGYLSDKEYGGFIYNSKGYDGHEIAACPTLQMAMKWLNDVHHILVVSDYEYEFTDTSWYFKIYRLGDNGKPERVPVKGVSYDDSGEHEHIVGYRDYERSYKDYATREEAEEDGIKYCLENLN